MLLQFEVESVPKRGQFNLCKGRKRQLITSDQPDRLILFRPVKVCWKPKENDVVATNDLDCGIGG